MREAERDAGGRDWQRCGTPGEGEVQPKGTCFILLAVRDATGHVPQRGGRGRRGARASPTAAGAPVLEDEEPHNVDGEAEGADDEHQLGVVYGLRLGEAEDGVHEDGEAEGGEEDGVAERSHRLGAAVAVGGAGTAAAAAGDAPGREPHAEGDEVREHVEGVGHQREGVAQVSGHQLGHEEADGEHQHEDEAARLARVPPHGGRAARPVTLRASAASIRAAGPGRAAPPGAPPRPAPSSGGGRRKINQSCNKERLDGPWGGAEPVRRRGKGSFRLCCLRSWHAETVKFQRRIQ